MYGVLRAVLQYIQQNRLVLVTGIYCKDIFRYSPTVSKIIIVTAFVRGHERSRSTLGIVRCLS